MANKLREMLASVLYIGYIPGAPGTYGSIAALAAFVLAGKPLALAGWVVFLALVLVSIFALSGLREVFGADDPGEAVLDEAAGMWLTLLVGGAAGWILMAVGFVLFRIFDIAKPFPIKPLERLPGWRGVLADDLGAGLAAGLLVRLFAVFVSS